LGQEVPHGDLQGLHYQQDGMHEQQPTMKKDNEFLKVLFAKQNPKNA
jgi:hypothetical protein